MFFFVCFYYKTYKGLEALGKLFIKILDWCEVLYMCFLVVEENMSLTSLLEFLLLSPARLMSEIV